MNRRILLAGYILVPGSHFTGMWRHPYSETDYCDPALYRDVARTLERSGFDLAFIPESLSVTTGMNGDYRTFLEHGAVGAIRHDPAHLAGVMADATRHLGFTVTLSTTYMEPYHLARTLSTLSHFSQGRMSWNVVTSAGASNALNFGHFERPDSPTSYRRAEETLEICNKLWQSWDPDALVLDKENGRYADPGKVHPLNHEGEFFKVQGPLSMPAAPGGGPILMSVGVSPRGRDFSAKWVNVIFAIQNDAAGMAELRNDVRARAERMGRDPEKIKLLSAVQPIVGETNAIAEARAAYYDELIHPKVARAFLSGMIGVDVTGLPEGTPIDEVLEDKSKAAVDGGAARPWLEAIRAENPAHVWTVDDIALRISRSTSTPRLIGDANRVADQLEAFFSSESCDGFVITPTHFPGSFDEFGRAVIPELRRRGLMPNEPDKAIDLRGKLGL